MATKKDWHQQVENEQSLAVPDNEIHETDDGKTIRIEYREEDGKIYKTTKTFEKRKCIVLPIVAERKKWKKFGDAKNDPPGINSATTKIGDEIKMDFISSVDDDMIIDMAQKILGIQCRRCKGSHLTAKCPHKDRLPEITERQSQITNKDATTEPPVVHDAPQPRKYVPPAKRPGASGIYETDKQDEATIRVSNLPEETVESDMRDLFQSYGRITRISIPKSRINNGCRGIAFITFAEKRNAQMAKDCTNGHGYGHLILEVEWSETRRQNYQ